MARFGQRPSTSALASLRQQRLACRAERPRTGFMSPILWWAILAGRDQFSDAKWSSEVTGSGNYLLEIKTLRAEKGQKSVTSVTFATAEPQERSSRAGQVSVYRAHHPPRASRAIVSNSKTARPCVRSASGIFVAYETGRRRARR